MWHYAAELNQEPSVEQKENLRKCGTFFTEKKEKLVITPI
jgi:hypothetical protein